jgi:hypothetical protein
MVQSLVFLALLLGCCGYAILFGGTPERIAAFIFVAASVLTLVALSSPPIRWNSVEYGALLVDAATLVALLALAFRAERFWLLWVTALQAIGTAGHAVKLADPDVIRWGYAFALAFWSYPMLFLLVLGTWNHQKRLARFGVDKSWSSSSPRSGLPPPGGPIS